MDNKNTYSLIWINGIITLAVVALIVLPLFLVPHAEYSGSDDQAETVITKIQSDYHPWFTPLWKPPSDEIESFLFALQAALGAGFIGYYIGTVKGKAGNNNTPQQAAGMKAAIIKPRVKKHNRSGLFQL